LKIFFTASYRCKNIYQSYYDTIIKKLQSLNCDIYSLELTQCNLSDPESKNKCIKNAIKVCDACVIEISGDTFQLGYEVALISQYNLPILCLSNNRDYKKILNRSNALFIKYNNNIDLEQQIEKFINKNLIYQAKIRLNVTIPISNKIKLIKYSKEKSISISQAINQLIEQHISLE